MRSLSCLFVVASMRVFAAQQEIAEIEASLHHLIANGFDRLNALEGGRRLCAHGVLAEQGCQIDKENDHHKRENRPESR